MANLTTMIDIKVTTAADLKAALQRIEDGGFNLADLRVTSDMGDPVGSVEIQKDTDTGEHRLSFWLVE